MVEEGLFEQFPGDAVYGLHNMPGMPAGTVALRSGPAMAAFDIFEIVVTGKGTHAAMPQLGIDPVVTGAQIVTALQTIASRRTEPLASGVVSVAQFHAGAPWNGIPETDGIRGPGR